VVEYLHIWLCFAQNVSSVLSQRSIELW